MCFYTAEFSQNSKSFKGYKHRGSLRFEIGWCAEGRLSIISGIQCLHKRGHRLLLLRRVEEDWEAGGRRAGEEAGGQMIHTLFGNSQWTLRGGRL